MQTHFKTSVLKTHQRLPARLTQVETPHGTFSTPMFMPVATRAFMNYLTTPDLIRTGSEIILGGNTYHMLCHPGLETLEALGGMHTFMHWTGPMLTDSGGFQVFSLSKNNKICKIDEAGAHFKHPDSGKIIHLTPETSIGAQKVIGADIIMAFDQCTPSSGGRAMAEKALARTHRWLMQSKQAHMQSPNTPYGHRQALFGIIQGGEYQDLREQSTQFVVEADLDGIAIGGEVIGFDMQKTEQIIDWVRPMLPENKTRYTMGVGLTPQDLLDVVAKGIDIFDCVAPTRNARHGALYHGEFVAQADWLRFESMEPRGRILIKKACYAHDDGPILTGCECDTCQHYSRGYLHYLFKNRSVAYCHLACIHNVHIMQLACKKMRECITQYCST